MAFLMDRRATVQPKTYIRKGILVDSQIALFIDFENIAIRAQENNEFFDVDKLLSYLEDRGNVVVRRGYADWGQFPQYRAELVNNAIDLIQLYTVRPGKNRADIRLVLDAFEQVFKQEQIDTFVIVSGDSDFGPLVSRLREYGKYVIGLGPRGISHRVLIVACNEFHYLEELLPEARSSSTPSFATKEQARQLLQKALDIHAQDDDLPVLATRLKQTILTLDDAFDERELGHAKFRGWLEANRDLVSLRFDGLQMFVSPADVISHAESALAAAENTLRHRYRAVFNRTIYVDLETRRRMMRDIYQVLHTEPWTHTPEELLDQIKTRYVEEGHPEYEGALLRVWQTGFYQRAYAFSEGHASFTVPVALTPGLSSEEDFIKRVESGFVYGVLKDDLEVDMNLLADVLLNDPEQSDYIERLIEDVDERNSDLVDWDVLPLDHDVELPEFMESCHLQVVLDDLEETPLPNVGHISVEAAQQLAHEATMARREHRWEACIDGYCQASRVHMQAMQRGERQATPADLAWYLASYASVKAGEYAQVRRDYAGAEPYYLAFFYLLDAEPTLWNRVRRLASLMLYHYWANVGRAMGFQFNGAETPEELASQIHDHPNAQLVNRWQSSIDHIAEVSPEFHRWAMSLVDHAPRLTA
jgi:uncharacterized protein (TIGR00288 family)